MKASELRIGNLLEFANGIEKPKIITVGRRFFSSASIEREDGDFEATPYYRSIPITAEWLERLGFSFNRSVAVFDEFQKENIVCMIWKNGRKDLGLDTNVVSYGNKHIKCQFVHQLQNLYYALCGEELTIKTESK